MKIFYFTATGNSKWAAEEIGKAFSADVVSINQYHGEKITDQVIGLVGPVYMQDAPWYFKKFLLSLNAEATYVFGVFTYNREDIHTADSLDMGLCTRGMKLSYFKNLLMPGNCVESSIEANEERLLAAPSAVKEIVEDIQNRVINYHSPGISAGEGYVENSYYYGSKLKIMKRFRISSKCNGCGLCAGKCPVGAIQIQNGKAKHTELDKCTACMRCFHLCPQNAVRLWVPVRSNDFQYIHPDIRVEDLD